MKEHRSDKAATGSYIYHACNKQIQDRYLSEVDFSNPKDIWDKLKAKLQGDDADSRSRLLSKFMSMTRPKTMNIQQFANKLVTIQKLLNPTAAGQTEFITDKMVLGQIYRNAGAELRSLTTNLQTNVALTLADVLRRYELAEEAMEADATASNTDGNVSALNVNKSNPPTTSRPRQIMAPQCPEDWSGAGCWFHNSGSHHANDCDSLKALQMRVLATTNTPPEPASPRRGYPPPGSIPRNRRRSESQTSANTPSSTSRTATPTSDGSRKRPLCNLCGESGHYTDKCPSLIEAVSALKKMKSASANVAETVGQLEPGEVAPK